MKSKFLLTFTLTFLTCHLMAAQKVRKVPVQGDQIVTIKTSIGLATIIQVPDRPNSVVVGDQDSFKVEYLDQAITIKPLIQGAKSNLYIYTDWKRFNVELVSVPQSDADYVVYLEIPKTKPTTPERKLPKIIWTKYKKYLHREPFYLNVTRLGRSTGGILFVEFHISSNKKMSFEPEWLWLTQNRKTRPIHSLVLSSLEVEPRKNIRGVLQIRSIDLTMNKSFRIEMRRKNTSYLTIKNPSSWKY
ncbi:MAG: TrbG/VirB9 family P-type conjugative transfer protein [Halobacteriovoraceae bacterium]|nr:TrbG/VirB9 family P-type conjugative transfer protein [Halobacteriovoraceae bacterium]MCB9093498.1 TrbG/VirB9 family P-type conjugative transfer protein [Halobacteriovoraceae bacterium]